MTSVSGLGTATRVPHRRIRRLAVGGMGEVFLARAPDGRLLVLKTMLPSLGGETDPRALLDEARLTALVKHPNVVEIFDVLEDSGEVVIAMEFVDGDSLAVLTRAAHRASRELSHLVTIVAQAARGLHAAHEARDASGRRLGIIHRDISPQNTLVSREGVTKLIDFGIARSADTPSRTREGTIKGKLSYMAPEQLREQPADVATDVFSLGVVLWEVCLGQRARIADSEIKLLRQVMEEPLRAPRAVDPKFDGALAPIIERAVAVDRRARFASCGALAEALEGWVASRPPPPEPLSAWVMSLLGTHLEARNRSVEHAGRAPATEHTVPIRPGAAVMPEAAEGSLIESILRGLPLTRELQADLMRLGVDPAHLKTKYRVDVWAKTIDIVRQHKYPELPSDESSRQLGFDFAASFAHTIGGRMVLALLPLLKTESLLAKVPRFFKLGRPDIAISWQRTAPGVGALHIVDAAQVSPYFDVGLIQYMLQRIGSSPQWRVEWKSLSEFVIHYTWTP